MPSKHTPTHTYISHADTDTDTHKHTHTTEHHCSNHSDNYSSLWFHEGSQGGKSLATHTQSIRGNMTSRKPFKHVGCAICMHEWLANDTGHQATHPQTLLYHVGFPYIVFGNSFYLQLWSHHITLNVNNQQWNRQQQCCKIYILVMCSFTFKGLLILDDVWVTHVGKDSHLLPWLLPFFIWHLWKIMTVRVKTKMK